MKKTSANTNYWRAKHHLQQILDGNPESSTQTVRPKSEDADAGSTKKPRPGAKRGAAKDASIKKEPSKRRKTVTKAASEPVKSAHAEETDDTTPADIADQTK